MKRFAAAALTAAALIGFAGPVLAQPEDAADIDKCVTVYVNRIRKTVCIPG